MHFITELSAGGAQTALFNLLAGFDSETYDFKVVCLYNGNGLAARRIAGLGIPVIDLGMANKLRLDSYWRLLRLMQQDPPQILHTWMFHANIPGRIIGRIARVRRIVSSERTMGQEGRLRRWLDRLTASFADRIICVSQEVARFAEQVIGLPGGKLVVIPNGIDPRRFENLPARNQARLLHGLPEEALIIGAIGRPRPVKGYTFLLQAFERLAQEHPASLLLFVGDGPDKMSLMRQAAGYNLNDRVYFLPDQEDIPALLPALDILAVPSLFEGMPNVALEAMAAGLPVAATRVGGVPEVVLDGETGLLVPPADAPTLAGALARLAQEPELRRRLGAAGKARACEQFSIQNVCIKTRALYSELLRDKV
jgi:glycosyltransferase involved in cell wall biosynthesis